MNAVLGVDLGGTTIKAGVVDETGTVHSFVAVPSRESEGREPWAQAALEAATKAAAATSVEPSALGLSVPGAVDRQTATLLDLVARLDTPTGGIDLSEIYSPLGLPVKTDNDARAALCAERRWGGHKDPDNLVLLTIGTGVGSAAVIDGEAPAGRDVLGGGILLGHTTVELDGELCVCGNQGCVETVASATALVRTAQTLGMTANDAADVFEADESGDKAAARAIDRFLSGLTAVVVNAIHVYRPSTVVLSGGVMAQAKRILPPLDEAVATRAWTIPRGQTEIVASRLGADGPVLAGASLALDRTQPASSS